jgi:acyl-CoA synthetase (AMP-forming)/AMP-acid ligase II
VWQNRRFTWGEFNARVNRLANALRRLGAGPGVPVASLLDNCNVLLELNFAAARIGAILVPIMPRSVPREIAHVVNDVRAKIVIAKSAAALAPVSAALGSVEAVIGLASGDALDLERLMHDASPDEPEGTVDPDAIGLIKYTSGTSGSPKGCARTHRQTRSRVALCRPRAPL